MGILATTIVGCIVFSVLATIWFYRKNNARGTGLDSSEIFDRLRNTVEKVLEIPREDIKSESLLSELDANLFCLSILLEIEFGVNISQEDRHKWKKISDVVFYIDEKLKEKSRRYKLA